MDSFEVSHPFEYAFLENAHLAFCEQSVVQ